MAKPAKARERIKLLSCPFCGYELPKLEKQRDSDNGPSVYMVGCDGCDANGPVMGGNADRARVAWNHRLGPPEMLDAEARGVPEVVPEEDSDEPGEPQSASEITEEVNARKVEGATPCPWCKGTKVFHDSGMVKKGKRKKMEPYYFTYCQNCESGGPQHDTSAGFAALGWNKRFP